MARTGRRPGKPDTRRAILATAREAFARRGYAGASIRQIAGAAGVDPALVHHYFGTKDELLVAALELPFSPATLLPEVLAGEEDLLAERLLRTFLRIWDGPAGGQAVAALRILLAEDSGADLAREFLTSQILRHPALTALVADPATRIPLAASQLLGLIITRYVLRVEPLASASPDWLVATVAPTIQRYLTGELPTPDA